MERNQQDIIVNKIAYQTTYKDGCEIKKRIVKKVNVTKLVNESQKLIKTEQAKEKAILAELNKYYTAK